MSKKNAPVQKKKPHAPRPKAIEHANLIARSLFAVDAETAENAHHMQAVLMAIQNDGGVNMDAEIGALNRAVAAADEGLYFDDLIGHLRRAHPSLSEALTAITSSALDYSDRTWREGYLVGLAVGRRTAGGAR